MKTRHASPAFTLVETLITMSVFAVVSVLSVTLLVNGFRAARKIQAQVLLYSEAQTLMEQMALDIQGATVDYEAYYARAVRGDSGWDTPDYGKYAQAFYDPGSGGTEDGPYEGVNVYGSYYKAQCPSDTSLTNPEDCPEETPVYSQLDMDTGTHPFLGIDDFSGYVYDPEAMNAFCESDDGATDCTEIGYGVQSDLILVNPNGDSRTVYALKPFSSGSSEYFLGKMELSGTDTTNDGIVDLWSCSSTYSSLCSDSNAAGGAIPADENDFVTLNPDSLRIEEFYVLIHPFEDPYRAFGEEEVQVQPQVTIVLTVGLSSANSEGLLGAVPSITLQRTVSTGVYAKVPSYE